MANKGWPLVKAAAGAVAWVGVGFDKQNPCLAQSVLH